MKTKIEIKTISGEVIFKNKEHNNSISKTLHKYITEQRLKGRTICLEMVNLEGADLRNLDLSGVDLNNANLSNSDLSNADLRYANLSYADLSNANLSHADLNGANLSSAYLNNVNLSYANLLNSNLSYSHLEYSNLNCALLKGANFSVSTLSGAELGNVNLSESTAFLLSQCPEEGSFIGFKKAKGLVIKLRITENAKRSSSTTLKCRCSEAEVLEIQNIDGSKAEVTEISSNYDSTFVYKVGEIVRVDDFDEDRFKGCSTGIHFFINREMAVKY
jgi:hypothetical protein